MMEFETMRNTESLFGNIYNQIVIPLVKKRKVYQTFVTIPVKVEHFIN